MLPRPSVREERWLALAALLGREVPLVVANSGGWHVSTLPSRCTFFLLGLIGTVSAAAFAYLLQIPGALLVTAVAAFVLGEQLVAGRRFLATGIEESLAWMGTLLLVLQLLEWRWASDAVLALCAAAGLLLLGLRLLNPLLTTGAALAFVYAMGELSGSSRIAALLSLSLAILALALGGRRIARPSYDRMLDLIVVLMPVAGYLWQLQGIVFAMDPTRWRSQIVVNTAAVVALSVYAALALLIGLMRRRHAPVLASLLCMACVASELHAMTDARFEWRLIIEGAAVLLLATALVRWLRTARGGITSRPLTADDAVLDMLQTTAASGLMPSAPATGRSEIGGGGRFGGGGADGSF
jgi:uncharacterized membrane protein YphA (DoxX/SURF4 family)